MDSLKRLSMKGRSLLLEDRKTVTPIMAPQGSSEPADEKAVAATPSGATAGLELLPLVDSVYRPLVIHADHLDLIQDVAYDIYGRRMVSCSSDQTVKVWDLSSNGQEWKCTSGWKAHLGAVWKVTWAHPEFGQIIATCSFDRSAAVWEEVSASREGGSPPPPPTPSAAPPSTPGTAIAAPAQKKKQWLLRASLVDSRSSLTDVKFSPKELGLQLATCSSDGVVRIYEALDVMNLAQWRKDFDLNLKASCSCLAWSPVAIGVSNPLIAVGSNDSSRFSSSSSSATSIPSASAGGSSNAAYNSGGASSTSRIALYEYRENTQQWVRAEVTGDFHCSTPVNDICFAPNVGRSCHLLAVASQQVKIFSIRTRSVSSLQDGSNSSVASGHYYSLEATLCLEDSSHIPTAWRVAWNATGTMLSSTGDDGFLRLYRLLPGGTSQWACCMVLQGNGLVANSLPGTNRLMAEEAAKAYRRVSALQNVQESTSPSVELTRLTPLSAVGKSLSEPKRQNKRELGASGSSGDFLPAFFDSKERGGGSLKANSTKSTQASTDTSTLPEPQPRARRFYLE
ncbi:unnamed protein product [Cyprideis torosa]|uniref:Uncharacterized protein n=1 Tax=Cyprideis torosa TaxID=163714 RepID=A0A7R8W4J4_9CRUS|nr:unnamed protein product [Cyprideis torosa]CAG0879897.1 unnamed protein product [Cyprideis torosa]